MPPDTSTGVATATVVSLAAHPAYFQAYREAVREWEYQAKDEKTKIARIGAVRTLIRTSCSERALLYITDKNTAYDMLATLKARLAPTNHATEISILRRLNTLKTWNKGTAVEGWLDSWESTYNQALEHKLPAIQGSLICIEFVDAIESIDPQWSTMMEAAMLNSPTKYDLFELINAYRNRHRTQLAKHPQNKNSAFATLNNKDQNGQNKAVKKAKRPCLCGLSHEWVEYYYLQLSKAPANFVGFTDIYTKIKEKIKELS
jgi:hypothetical protein